MRERNGWRIRVIIVAVLITFMFVLITARMFQLSILSDDIYKIQSSMSSETKALKSELMGKINEFTTEKETIDKSLKALEQRLLVSKKDELLKEISDLRLQHQRLMAEVQNLQERVSGLSAVEEKTITRILGAYERTLNKQRKFEFVINFVLGVFSSVIASLLYSLAAHYKLVPRIRTRHIFRKIPIIKKLYRNVRAPSTDVKPLGPS